MENREDIVRIIRQEVINRVGALQSSTNEAIKESVTNCVLDNASNYYMSIAEKNELIKDIYNAICGMGVLQPLLEDDEITEIMVNGPDKIFIEKNGQVKRLALKIENMSVLEDMIQSIVSKVNREVNEACPLVDARLQDGSRVGIVLPPISLDGPVLTIRKFSSRPMTMERLVTLGSISQEASEFLCDLIKAHYNIFICGGTGSGKTTFLNALSSFIPRDERLITIEDSAELQLKDIENLVRMETRNKNTEGLGSITIRDLIKMSLRLRPERIIVGEVRGAEALDMLQAMNTGHDGSLSTGHGNSCRDMLSRLETMVLLGAMLPLGAIRQQIASALDIMIHVGRLRDKSRRILEITEVAAYAQGEIRLNPLFEFIEDGQEADGSIKGKLVRTTNIFINKQKLQMAGLFCGVSESDSH